MKLEDYIKKDADSPLKRSEVVDTLIAGKIAINAMADGFDINNLPETANGMRGVAAAYEVAAFLITHIEVLD